MLILPLSFFLASSREVAQGEELHHQERRCGEELDKEVAARRKEGWRPGASVATSPAKPCPFNRGRKCSCLSNFIRRVRLLARASIRRSSSYFSGPPLRPHARAWPPSPHGTPLPPHPHLAADHAPGPLYFASTPGLLPFGLTSKLVTAPLRPPPVKVYADDCPHAQPLPLPFAPAPVPLPSAPTAGPLPLAPTPPTAAPHGSPPPPQIRAQLPPAHLAPSTSPPRLASSPFGSPSKPVVALLCQRPVKIDADDGRKRNTVFFGTHTGTTEGFAKTAAKEARAWYEKAVFKVVDLDDYAAEDDEYKERLEKENTPVSWIISRFN